ncbi:major facilitator superfamily domain-containing protein [Radiomyces spectabilis]|uniref:major facilitator superfamily domain-containing protein n=1 Tax=Radiomyces spectabilis TaxID=64574 RepID=UPI00221FF698|nr:major facilitator superfamily domain-containing protein [Radiomyces spectabilis]KAI8391282.1 major facilitator superfamily domain-containing protein [Radiomyces spectabilis]
MTTSISNDKYPYENDLMDHESLNETIKDDGTQTSGIPRQSWAEFLMGNIYAKDDPYDFSRARKAMIIMTVSLCGISGPLSSMIYMPGLLSVAADLHTSLAAVNGTVSAFVVFMGIAPLFWASLSDHYGRKRMYLISIVLNIVASVICANSRNIAMLIVFRAVQACGSSAGQSLGAGVIADTIHVADRGKAYGFFYIGPLIGPVIGPTIGGALCQYLGWRSTFYFLAILGGVLLVMVAFLLPETLRIKDSTSSQQPHVRTSTLHMLRRAFGPMASMCKDPTVINPTITDTFQSLYGYDESQVGLCYLAFGIGLMVGSVVSGQHADYVVRRLREKTKDCVQPEMRLRASTPSFILIPAGYLIYGWTTEKGIGVYAPLIGLFVYALGQMWAFTPTSVYLVDSKPGRSASAVAINNCVRSVAAAIATLFSSQALHAAGPGILYTIIAAINVANIALIVLVMVFGQRWRTRYEHKSHTAGPNMEDEKLNSSTKHHSATLDRVDTHQSLV